MTRILLVTLALTLGLSACGTRLNPFNWFGNAREEAAPAAQVAVAQDGRELMTEIVSLQVDRYPGGAIISAMGLPPRQGWWEADLVALPRSGGDLVFEFRALQPPQPTREGPPSREVLAGVNLTDQQLAGVTTITVRGLVNQRSVRR